MRGGERWRCREVQAGHTLKTCPAGTVDHICCVYHVCCVGLMFYKLIHGSQRPAHANVLHTHRSSHAQRNEELHGALVAACGVLGLQPVPPFVSKAIQLWDTFHVRFGAMLVRARAHAIFRGFHNATRRCHPLPMSISYLRQPGPCPLCPCASMCVKHCLTL